MADGLEFDIAFGGVDIESVKKAWAANEAKIQNQLNSISKLKVPIDASSIAKLNSDLAKTEKMLARIQKAQQQSTSTKPLTSLQAGKLDIARTSAAVLTEQRLQTEISKTNAQKANAERANINLAKTKDRLTASQNRSISSTQKSTQAWQQHRGVLNGIPQYLNAYASILGGVRLVDRIREVTSEFELQKVALGAIIQDKAKADQLFAQVTQLAVQSPFQVKELITYTKELSAYRIETENLFDTTKRLADISAGLGVDMGRLILAYGQVKAASVLRGQELRQFTEAGIPLVSLLADKFGELRGEMVTTGEVFQLISERAVSFGMVKEIFDDMTNAGGTFYNMQKIQAETLAGSWSNLRDEMDLMFNAMGQDQYSVIKGFIDASRAALHNWEAISEAIVSASAAFGVYKLALILNTKLTGKENQELIKSILSTKAKTAEQLKQASAYRTLSVAEQRSIDQKKQITIWDLKQLIASKGITKEQALRMIATKKLSTVQAEYLVRQGLITQAENAQAASTSRLGRAKLMLGGIFRSVGSAAKSLWVTLIANPYTWLFAIIAGVTKLFLDHKAKIDDLKDTYTGVGQSIKGLISEYKELDKLLKSIESRKGGQLSDEDVSGLLSDYEDILSRNEQFSSIVNERIKNISNEREKLSSLQSIWVEIGKGIDAAQEKSKLLADINYQTDEIFGDDFLTNISNAIDALDEVNREVFQLQKQGVDTSDYSKGFDELIKSGASITDLYKYANSWGKIWSNTLDENIYGIGGFQKKVRDLGGSINTLTLDQKQFFNLLKSSITEINGEKIDWNAILNTGNKTSEQEAFLITIRDSFVANMKIAGKEASEDVKERFIEIFNTTFTMKVAVEESSTSKAASQFEKSLKAAYDKVYKEMPIPKELLRGGFKFDFTNIYSPTEGKAISDDISDLWMNVDKLTESLSINSDMSNKGGKSLTDYDKILVQYKKNITEATLLEAGLSKFRKSKDGNEVADNRLSLLNEEVSQVEKVYQAYKKLADQIGAEGARKEIELLFGTLDKATGKMKVTGTRFDIAKTAKEMSDAYKLASDYASKLPKSEKPVMELNFKASQTSWDALVEDAKEKLAQLQSKIEEQQKANDFFGAMLGMTGDREFAADITVGIYGAGFEDTAALIKEQLTEAFKGIDISLEIGGDVIDYAGLLKKAQALPKEMRDVAVKLVQQGIEARSKEMQDLLKNLADYSTYEYQRVEIARKAAEQIKKINESPEIPKARKPEVIESVKKQEKKELAKVNYEEFKNSDLYVKMFENLDRVSTTTLDRLKVRLKELRGTLGENADPAMLKEIVSKFEALDNQMVKRNPFKTLRESIAAYKAEGKSLAESETDYLNTKSEIEKAEALLKVQKRLADAAKKTIKPEGGVGVAVTVADPVLEGQVSSTKKLIKELKKRLELEGDIADRQKLQKQLIGISAEEVGRYISAIGDSLGEIGSLAEELGANEETVMWINEIGKTLSGLGTISQGIGKITQGDVLGGIGGVVTGLVDTISGIFGAAYIKRVRKANQEIAKQNELLKQLEYSYGRLQKASEDALGTDYIENYNEQYEKLIAKQRALEKSAQAERSKGKKEDEEATQGYLDAARDAKDEAEDLLNDFAEKIAGVGLADFAKDMASVFVEAKLAGENAMDALNKKWREVLGNMIKNTLLAQAVQRFFEPVFKKFNELLDNPKLIESTQWLNELEALFQKGADQSYQMMEAVWPIIEKFFNRSADTADGLTGIAKNVAQASEDQITGLAAGINTQNAYFGQSVTIWTNIYLIMQKWDERKAEVGQGTTLQSLITTQQTALTHLKAIETNTGNTATGVNEILSELRSIIKPKGVPSTKVVKTEL